MMNKKMNRKGYVYSIFVFLIFLSVFVIAITNFKSVTVMQESNYERMTIMKASAISRNIETILEEAQNSPPFIFVCADFKDDIIDSNVPFNIDVNCTGTPTVSVTSLSCDYISGYRPDTCP